ncbi:hypothetical protein Tco_1302693 [Tanacetum coccineum]
MRLFSATNEPICSIKSSPSVLTNSTPVVSPSIIPSRKRIKKILQNARRLKWKLITFYKEYDHIPPNEKCMALLLAEERFLKIRQVMEKEQNQPRVMQELLLKLMDDLQNSLRKSTREREDISSKFYSILEFFYD